MPQAHGYIDSDGHVIEPADLWERYLDPEFREEMPSHDLGYRGDPYAYINECRVKGTSMPTFLAGKAAPMPGLREAYEEYQEMGFSPAAYSLVLDRSKIDYMVVYPTAGLFMTAVPELSAETAAAYRRAYNRWLGDFCGECDGRVVGVASLDLRDPVEAAREARRCVEAYGFKAATVAPDPVTRYPLFHPFHDPLWSTLQDLDIPIAFHAGAGTPLNVGVEHFFDWATGRGAAAFCMGNMLACMAMIGGGVLERFPRLRVAHLEVGCGWLPYWLDRMQSGIQGSNRAGSRFLPMEGLSLHPVEYFRRQCFVACDPDDPHLAWVASEVGEECLVTASDFGHPEGRGYLDAVRETLELEGVSMELKHKIMWDNPARLYALS